MNRRRKRREKGGLKPTAHTTVTPQSNAAAKTEAPVPGRSHSQAGLVLPASSPDVADALQLPTDATPLPCPPAKRPRCCVHPQQGKHEEKQQQKKGAGNRADTEEHLICSSNNAGYVACSNSCSARPGGEDVASSTSAQEQPSASIQNNACVQNNNRRRTPASLTGPKDSFVREGAVHVSAPAEVDRTPLNAGTGGTGTRCGLPASRLKNPPSCAMAGASAASSGVLAGAASNIALSPINSPELNNQDDLVARAADALSPTKELLVLAESGKGEDHFQHATEQRVDHDDGSEPDVNEAAERTGLLLLSGRSTQPTLLQTHQDSVLPSTQTPRLQLNACCSSGVRSPPAGSPLSMSSQASTNSAFSASPLTCCSTVGPNSLPATPSCWLSDEQSPHQTQKHPSDTVSPAGAGGVQQEQQQNGSVFLWEDVSSSTPMRSSAVVPSSAVPPERSVPHDNDAEEECASLLSLSFGSSSGPWSCGRLNTPSFRDRDDTGNSGKLVATRAGGLPEPGASERATEAASKLPALQLPGGSAEVVHSAVAAATSEYVDNVWKRRDQHQKGRPVERSEQTVTLEDEKQNSTLVLKSNCDTPFFVREGRAERRATAFGGRGQCRTAPARACEGLRKSSNVVERGSSWQSKEERQAAEGCQASCDTSGHNRGLKSSPADCTVATVATAAISLPLQLPIPARAPRGKANNGRHGRQQQLAGLPAQQIQPEAEALKEESCPAASAEESSSGRGIVAGAAQEAAGNIAGVIETSEEVHTRTGKAETKSRSPLLPTLLRRKDSTTSVSVSDVVAKKQEGTSRCRLQLPADRTCFDSHGQAQQQQAAALTAMERAAARAKLAARAAVACAAVIDAAAAAARNAAAACAANHGSAGTAAGDYTEYPDLQRSIHDDYDLFCSTLPEAVAFLESATYSTGTATSREAGRAGTNQHLWQPLGQVSSSTSGTDFLRPQTCRASAEELVGGRADWPDMGRNSARRSSSGTATTDSRSSSQSRTSTRCTDGQSRSDVTVLRSDALAVAQLCRGCIEEHGKPRQQCDLTQRQDLHCVPRENESVDSDCQSQRPARNESCSCFRCCDSEAEPPRDDVEEPSCETWASDVLKTSRHLFSRSSSLGTDASRYTLGRTGSTCTRCGCCRSCSLTKCSSLASSPRSRLEHLQKPQWSCDLLPGSNHNALLSSTPAQQGVSLSSATSRENDVLICVAEQTTALQTHKVADRENKVEAEGRTSAKSVKENSSDEGTVPRQSDSGDGSSGHMPGAGNSTVAFSAELLKSALASLKGVTDDTLKTDVPKAHPSLQTVPSFGDGTDGATASTERQMTTTERSGRHVILGAGRFGKVVLGHHNHSGLLVAVKIIDKSRVRAACSEDDEVNFRQEIEMHRRLPAHRNIVTVYDVYEDRKCMYLVMELCDRVSLLDKLAEEGPLREDLARQIFVQILAAVKHCHDHHVVHRDLKPENVLFARRQQPADSGRQTCKPPTPPPLSHSCGTCQPTGRKAPPASCTGVASCCCWMPHVDSSCEKPPFGHALQCTFSSALCPTRHQTSECCYTRREAESAKCGSCSPAAVDLQSETATGRGGAGLTAPADQGRNLCFNQVQRQNVRSSQQKGAEARGTTVADACGRSEEGQEITSSRIQQQGTPQQEVDPQQTCPHGERQLSGNFQRQRESALELQRPSAERGNTRQEVALCELQGVEPARPAENKAASLRNPELLSEGGATQEKPPGLLAVAGRCCCCRCCGQEDAERDTRNNHLLSLHMWRRRDRQEPPTVKLIDFGAACSSARGQLRGTACGTTHYLAPEVLTGNYYDGFASDAWSLGVILFTMLAAAPPFDGLTHSRLTRQIVRGEYRMDGLVWWKVSADAKNLILRLLDVNPQTRITVNEAARHPWLMRALPSGLPPLFFEDAHCLSSLATAAGETTQPDGESCVALFEKDSS